MRTIQVQKLTHENFYKFGFFADMMGKNFEKIGNGPVQFYRDILQANMKEEVVSFSVVETQKRELIIKEAEQHSHTCEALLPLDDDIVIFVAPSTDKKLPFKKIEAFIVPQNYLIVLKSGVWHKAPFPVNEEDSHTLVVLPERTYANDTYNLDFPGDEYVKIDI